MLGGVASAIIFGSKDIILFNECYELPKYNNYKTYKNSTDNDFDEWSLEINLKKNIITRTVIWTDKFIAAMQSMGTNVRKIEIETFPIISSNSRFVGAQFGEWEYIFDINNKTIQTFHTKYKSITNKKCSID
jgi:hypothetical protein